MQGAGGRRRVHGVGVGAGADVRGGGLSRGREGRGVAAEEACSSVEVTHTSWEIKVGSKYQLSNRHFATDDENDLSEGAKKRTKGRRAFSTL